MRVPTKSKFTTTPNHVYQVKSICDDRHKQFFVQDTAGVHLYVASVNEDRR